MTDVTVVVSFKDNAATLPDTVRSVLAQTHEDWRSSCSTTVERRRCRPRRRDHGPECALIRYEANLGTPVRLNQLTHLVDTPYLARLDGDDLMHPERLARSLEVLDDRPDVSFVAGHAVSIDRSSRPSGLRPSWPCRPWPTTSGTHRSSMPR